MYLYWRCFQFPCFGACLLYTSPDKKNYDISELGLSAEAARNLYTGRVNPEVVSRLLENRRFAQLTSMIAL